MKLFKISKLLIGTLIFSLSSSVLAAVVDTIDASDAQADTYFVPSLGQETDSPYYRGAGEDWGWTHNSFVTGFTSASLNISGYDVDQFPCGSGMGFCELDVIEAYDNNLADWVEIGSLEGDNNAFSFTNFVLGNEWFEDIELGLQVRMLIDENENGWLVSLAKSVLEVDGGSIGNPDPSVVPIPAAVWLFGTALIGLVGFSKRRKAA